MLHQSGLITECHWQKRQKISVDRKMQKQRVRLKRSVDRMTEENRGLREAEVEKGRVKFFFSQIKLISNAECKKKLAGIYKIYPSHICGFTPGSLSFSSLLFSLKGGYR